jgi:hypothetical protein
METLIRKYHGCAIESIQAATGDGWRHTVTSASGVKLGTTDTLAAAVALAKKNHGPYEYGPIVEEAPISEEED